MFRLFRLFLVIKLLLMVGGASYLYITRVAKAEEYLSKKLGATVTLKDVSAGLKSLKLSNIQISSPSFPKSALFKAEQIEIEMHPWELWKRDVTVSGVKIFNPVLGIHFLNRSGSENNWQEGMKKASHLSSKRFSIESLKVMNLQFAAYLPGGRSVQLPSLPYFELRDLNSRTLVELERICLETISAKEPSLADLFTDLPQGGTFADNEDESVVKKALNRVKRLLS